MAAKGRSVRLAEDGGGLVNSVIQFFLSGAWAPCPCSAAVP